MVIKTTKTEDLIEDLVLKAIDHISLNLKLCSKPELCNIIVGLIERGRDTEPEILQFAEMLGGPPVSHRVWVLLKAHGSHGWLDHRWTRVKGQRFVMVEAADA